MFLTEHHGADRHPHNQILPGFAVFFTLITGLARLSCEQLLVAKRSQSVLVATSHQYYVAAVTTVAAVWSAMSNKFLVPKGQFAVTALAGLDFHLHFIHKHSRPPASPGLLAGSRRQLRRACG